MTDHGHRRYQKPRLRSRPITAARFSLLELLVVLTIIAMLAGILVPSLVKSRQQAQKTNCISNLKQLGIATRLYYQDQRFYPEAYLDMGSGRERYWCFEKTGTDANFAQGAMADYILAPELLRCPSFTDFTSLDPNKPATSSYGINAEYVGGSPEPGTDVATILDNPPATPEEIKRPELTVLFADAAKMQGKLKESWLIWARYSYSTGAQLDPTTHFRHGNRAVAVFCDGHCDDTLKPDAIENESNRLGWLDLDNMKRH